MLNCVAENSPVDDDVDAEGAGSSTTTNDVEEDDSEEEGHHNVSSEKFWKARRDDHSLSLLFSLAAFACASTLP